MVRWNTWTVNNIQKRCKMNALWFAEGHVTWIPTTDLFCLKQTENNDGISYVQVVSSVLVVGSFMKWWLWQKRKKNSNNEFNSIPHSFPHVKPYTMLSHVCRYMVYEWFCRMWHKRAKQIYFIVSLKINSRAILAINQRIIIILNR